MLTDYFISMFVRIELHRNLLLDAFITRSTVWGPGAVRTSGVPPTCSISHVKYLITRVPC